MFKFDQITFMQSINWLISSPNRIMDIITVFFHVISEKNIIEKYKIKFYKYFLFFYYS